MTRHYGTFSSAALQAHCGSERPCVTNDLTVPALALSALHNEELHLAAGAGPAPDSACAPRLGEACTVPPLRACCVDSGRLSSGLVVMPVFAIRACRAPAMPGAAPALERAAR
jgi:hypothetical protein